MSQAKPKLWTSFPLAGMPSTTIQGRSSAEKTLGFELSFSTGGCLKQGGAIEQVEIDVNFSFTGGLASS